VDELMIRSLLLLNGCQQYDIRLWEKFEETSLEPEAFIAEGRAMWERLGITERCMSLMAKMLSSGWIDRELDACERLGVRVIACRDAIYPRPMLDLDDAPMLLYTIGELFSVGSKAVGVVGTRRCSAYGAGVAREIGRLAAAQGWCVVSGGAKGIDGAAHEGCLEGKGRTVAVMGTGIDVVYPSEHRGLFERIAATGALYSEYPLGSSGVGWRFPRRNRIVVGLTARTVVVEAPHKSGAMITARQAAEAGREVWAVPGRIGDERCVGSNRLIFDGAMPLIDMETFFGTKDPQRTLFEGLDAAEKRLQADDAKLNETEKTLIALLTNRGDRTIDNLAGEAKMSAAEVFKAMSLLSLRGLVFSSGPGRYRLVD
jgi:DNA processing protein